MYVIAIAWLYVTLLMAATETSIVAGVLTFAFYGLAPLGLLLWLLGTPQRGRQRATLRKPLLQPDATGHAAGDTVTPVGKEIGMVAHGAKVDADDTVETQRL